MLQTGQTPEAFGQDDVEAGDSREVRHSEAPAPFAPAVAHQVVSAASAGRISGTGPMVEHEYGGAGSQNLAVPMGPPPHAEERGRRGTDPSHRPNMEAASTVTSAQPQSTKGRLVGFLVSYDVDPRGGYYALHTGTLRVGRKSAAPGLDIAIDHPTVSSNHAVFHFDSAKHIARVEDTDSANGTLLNDTAIAGQGPREIRDGDRLRFGAYNSIIKLVERA